MDFNSDGLKDLVAGDTEGNVWFFKNVGSAKEPRLAAGVKLEAGGKAITGTAPKYDRGEDGQYRFVANKEAVMGVYSKIHVTDWDGDGLLDLLVGQNSPRSSGSEILFYRNVGTAKQPKLAEPAVLDIGRVGQARPSPFVVDWDGDGKRDVLLGTDGNQVMFVRNVGSNARPSFAPAEAIELKGLERTTDGYRYRIEVVDWNNDGKLDLLVGTFYSQNGRGGNVWLFLRK